jgi:hypothetical protein
MLNIVGLNAQFMIENDILLPFMACYATSLQVIVAAYLMFLGLLAVLFFLSLWPLTAGPRFDPRPACVGFVVDRVTLGQIWL